MDFRIAIAGTNYRVDLVILCVELLCNVLGFLCDELLQKLLCVHCLLSYALNCFFFMTAVSCTYHLPCHFLGVVSNRST